jgi:hypothetical protein
MSRLPFSARSPDPRKTVAEWPKHFKAVGLDKSTAIGATFTNGDGLRASRYL